MVIEETSKLSEVDDLDLEGHFGAMTKISKNVLFPIIVW